MSFTASKLIAGFTLGIVCCIATATFAQQPIRHELIRGDMPPGMATFYYQMNNRSLANYTQPVQLMAPTGCKIELGNQNGFEQAFQNTVSVGMLAGPVYRFKLSQLPMPGKENQAVYPSIELINRLYPPEGLKNEFPVQIRLTEQDLSLALAGQLVTKVVYLENPRGPLPQKHLAGFQPSFDIGGGADPLRTAEQFGRPMAIVRLGSRVPMANDPSDHFNFGAPRLEVLPLPKKSKTAHLKSGTVRQVGHTQPATSIARPNGSEHGYRFADRNGQGSDSVMPLPIGTIETAHAQSGHRSRAFGGDKKDPAVLSQEYIFDGDDRNARTQVDGAFNVYGLDTEDTVGHFDTITGQRIVTPSNRVAIYAPRFATVRKVHGALSAKLNQTVNAFDERMQTVLSTASNNSTTTKQHVALDLYKGSRRASGLKDRTRGVLADSTTHLFGFRNVLEAFRNASVLRLDQFDGELLTSLQGGLQSARAWESDLGLRVFAKGVQPVIVRDVNKVQQLMSVESEDGTAMLRVLKLASQPSAKTGEIIEFTIRFDNISNQPIGNVTIMDNLTRRLELVEGSSSCSLGAKFVSEVNKVGSLLLRWEVTDPMEAGTGGVIRFKCRVR